MLFITWAAFVGSDKNEHYLIAFDPALIEFQHVHPSFKNGLWSVDLNFLTNGRYWIYLQGKSKALHKEFTISTRLTVQNEKEANTITALKEQRNGVSGNSVVSLSEEKLKSGQMVMPLVNFLAWRAPGVS
ncbi:MAG: hypothetical protein HQK53_08445 [Oligoflexia bacterium]|nr:hypothetical protein [Oligoflexia bacterium]